MLCLCQRDLCFRLHLNEEVDAGFQIAGFKALESHSLLHAGQYSTGVQPMANRTLGSFLRVFEPLRL